MDEKENERHNAYGHSRVETIDEEHDRRANQCSKKCCLPVEKMERWSKVWSRSDSEKETSKVRNNEGKQICHGNEGGDLIDIRQHRELGDNVGDDYGVCRLIAIFGALTKDGKSRYQFVPGQSLKEFGRTNDSHQSREKRRGYLAQEHNNTRNIDLRYQLLMNLKLKDLTYILNDINVAVE